MLHFSISKHLGLLRQRSASRYTKNVTEMQFLPMFGPLDGVGPCDWGAEIAHQLPNKSVRSNTCNAATGKILAKCGNTQFLRHFDEHWRFLCP